MKVGIWIDHRSARIVELKGDQETVKVIESGVEKHLRLSGGSRSATPWGPQDVAKEQSRDRKFARHLEQYYEQVVAAIRDAEAVFICGPGEAKDELRKKMEASKAPGARIVAVEAEDKMSERQLVVKVRKVFGEAAGV